METRKQEGHFSPRGEATIRLESLLEIPIGSSSLEAAIVSHPHPLYGGTMNNAVVYHVRSAFLEAGIPTLRFNFRGVEGSEGEHTGGAGELDDVGGAADILNRQGFRPLFYCGFSFGSLMAWWAASQRPASVAGYVGIAFPTETTLIPIEALRELSPATFPSLFVVGKNDEISKADRVTELLRFEQAPTLTIVPEADHLFTERPWKLAVKEAVADWLRLQGRPPLHKA